MRRNDMSNYKKYAMMAVSTILLPLAKRAIKKLVSKHTKERKNDSAVEECEDFVSAPRADQQESL